MFFYEIYHTYRHFLDKKALFSSLLFIINKISEFWKKSTSGLVQNGSISFWWKKNGRGRGGNSGKCSIFAFS